MNKAIFLDKDGTLIPDIPYNIDPDKISLSLDGVEGLKQFQQDGYKLMVVSNQPGIARGYFCEKQFQAVIDRVNELLNEQGIMLTDFYYCPHHPEGEHRFYAVECGCRKPKPGLLLQAEHEHELDLAQCWMIGDILNDVEAGNRAGCRTILIDNGGETEWVKGPFRSPEFTCGNINEAAFYIQNHSHKYAGLEQR